jgi:TetR/AcrR family transcriptional regulator
MIAAEQASSKDKQIHIIRSAQLLFAQFGLKRVTIDDIAKEAHVSKATIYKYFKNKTEIFDKVVQDEVNSLLTMIRRDVKAQKDAVNKLRAHLSVRLGRVSEFVNFYRVTQETWGDYWPHIARVRKDFMSKEQDAVAEILRSGKKSGELRVKDTDKAASILVLAIASVEFQWALEEGRFSSAELVDTMINMMVEGIGGASN